MPRAALRWSLLSAALLGCSPQPQPGGVHFVVRTTPSPDNQVLSPLLDPRVTALELRDDRTEDLLSRARFDPPVAGATIAPEQLPSLELGLVPVSAPRDLRMLALGAAGQQVLGVALSRDAGWAYGEDKEIVLELRRPLFFFGGSPRLVPPVPPPDPIFAPSRRLFEPLRDESKLRVVDPNSVQPLLTAYDRQLDPMQLAPNLTTAPPVSAAGGTYDGRSLLLANLAGNLHIVDTLRLEDTASVPLPEGASLPAQALVVDPLDRGAVILQYARTPPTQGRVGQVLLLRDLPGLRSRVSRDGELMALPIESTAQSPIGPPLAAAYAPDGSIDVVFGRPPLSLGEPDCTTLGGEPSTLRRYDPKTGAVLAERALPYTTAVAYTGAGERVLVQPCAQPSGALRRGQVVINKPSGDRVLAAAGVAQVATTRSAVIAVGRDDTADSPTVTMHGTVNILEGSAEHFASSQFELPPWQIPFRITTAVDGKPYTSSIDISMAPTDSLVYGVAVTPDRARALVLLRVQHKVRSLFLSTLGTAPNQVRCFIDWDGYTYHVLLINLQSGAREQDYMVGVQNRECSSRSYDMNDQPKGSCFSPCDPGGTNPYLRAYQEGYIPGAASALFGR
ncbi:MAG: hypothetical protein U1A78_23375 [Polyangia bacterium]